MADLTGKVAIVTGASKGLGVAIGAGTCGATAAVNCATGGKERNESYKTDSPSCDSRGPSR